MDEVKTTPAERMAFAREAKVKKQEEINAKLAKLDELEKRMASPESVDGMVPKTWMEVVERILGPEFRVSVMESSGGNYVIRIAVPSKYDRRVGDERQMMKEDHSVGLVRRASDVADVTRWCELIRNTILKQYPQFKV